MIKGVGVDLVDVEELARLLETMGDRVFSHIFTDAELADAATGPRRAERLAIRFAAKEAVFKAISRLLPERPFDLRIVESSHGPDGSLRVDVTPALRDVMERAGVTGIVLSASSEGRYVTVFALAQ